jgi:MoxR-like ATPase
MLTRHRLDTSLRFDRQQKQPDSRAIEVADVDPVPPVDPPTALVPAEPYLASEELEDAVNLAIALGRPLLLQGDPGAGKTRLAHAVAFALGLPLEEAYIKSTSRAQDLLYTYDAVRRLYEAQLPRRGRPGGGDARGRDGDVRDGDVRGGDVRGGDVRGGDVRGGEAERGGDVRDARHYIRLGPLGRAIARAGHGRRSIVLIDEIDKADIDFPNDLLRELDRLSFDVPEAAGLQYSVPEDRPDLRPVIFVTNNEEKTLPAAFLRRCIFHYVEFPDDRAYLDQILALHEVGDAKLRSEAIAVMLRLRELDLAKKPGLSELLDWVGYLDMRAVPATELAGLPHVGALLKQRSDQIRAAERLAGT